MMKEIKNPTLEQIAVAMEIVNKSEKTCCITGSRYALTENGNPVHGGNISIPKKQVRVIRYISTYGDTCGNVHYVLEGIDMYCKKAIVDVGLTPITPSEIPQYFESIETIIQQN